MEERINKITVITLALFFSFMSVFAQQMELNDPQIISVVETVNQIDIVYGKIAMDKTQNNKVKEFAQTMIYDYTHLFNQTLALEKELILSTQTNIITRALSKQMTETVKILKSRKQKYFDVTYVNNEVALHREAVLILKDILISQARNAKLKDFLDKISPLWEQSLKTARKIQVEINR